MGVNNRLEELFDRYTRGVATDIEVLELARLIHTPGTKSHGEELITSLYDTVTDDAGPLPDRSEAIFRVITAHTAPLKKLFNWQRLAVAASILVVIGLGSYLFFFNQRKTTTVAPVAVVDDVNAPDINRATIMLGNGQTVYLDSMHTGTLAVEGNVKVSKLADGQIDYTGTGTTVIYNTLVNPRGSKVINMRLSDGSRVWLNAGSSVRYPVVFTENTRMVTITGEAYFEVAYDPSKPFIVSSDETSVQVLGTHFNVNAYDDEASVKVTLLEGSVKVNEKKIVPGEQATVTGSAVAISQVTDMQEVMAWKNGLFQFESGELQAILRQFARWYDVEVVYERPIRHRKFFVMVSRSSSLKSVLELLADNNIRYKVEGKKLIVTSN